MPYYSDELIEEVRSANDIVDVISSYVHLQKKGNDYFGLCPFHNERTPSFSVSQKKQMYYCFGCGAGGNVVTFLMQYENDTFHEALEALAQRAGIELPKQELSGRARQEADKRAKIMEINKISAKYFYAQLRMEQGKKGLDYFAGRGLSPETLKKFGLGYANKFSDDLYQYLRKQGYEDEILKDSGVISVDERRGGHDKFWNRVMFPIMDANQRVIGFGGRVLGDGEPKYLNSPETMVFDKSRNLYGLNFARMTRNPYILLCEGYMDVIALHQAGFDNAVASLGTSFTAGHAALLKRYTKEVYCTFDSDNAGIKAALRAIPMLKEAGITTKIVNMKPYKDPDEFIKALGTEAFQERIEKAQSSFLFEIEVLERNFNLKDPAGKTAFFDQMARKLLGFSDELERNNYIETLSQQYHVGYEALQKKVNQMGIALGGVRPVERPRDVSSRKKEQEDGSDASQKLLLTWMISDPVYFREIRRHVSPEDFTVPLYERIAGMLYEQQERGELNPARIVNTFEDSEEQRRAAAVFNAELKTDTKEELEKALKEAVYKVLKNALEKRAKELDPTDMIGLQQVVGRRRQLEKLHISLD